MSFYSIKDPVLRDYTIQEYLDMKKRIKKRNMDERLGSMNKYRSLQSQYKPIIHSQQEMREDIVKHLQPIHQNLADVNEQQQMMRIKQEDLGFQQRKRRCTASLHENSPLSANFYNKLRQQDPNLDTSFGIYYDHDNILRIGSKPISIFQDNIIIDDREYRGTAGLWSLITEKNPKDYDIEDLKEYKELMDQTNALRRDFDPENQNPRSNKSKKWERILKPIWRDIIEDQQDDDDNDSDSNEEEEDGGGLMTMTKKRKVKKDPFRDGKIYLRKNGSCYRVKNVQSGEGLFLSSQHPSSSSALPGIIGDGLFIKQKWRQNFQW